MVADNRKHVRLDDEFPIDLPHFLAIIVGVEKAYNWKDVGQENREKEQRQRSLAVAEAYIGTCEHNPFHNIVCMYKSVNGDPRNIADTTEEDMNLPANTNFVQEICFKIAKMGKTLILTNSMGQAVELM